MMKSLKRLTLLTLAVAACALSFGAATSSAALPVHYSSLMALPSYLNGTASPPGANDWNCKPSSKHPRPVVLVHGTTENMAFNWNALSPLLKNNGYCVFALNYGATPASDGFLYGIAPIPESAQQLSSFVNRVLSATGKSKVDIVGHSQGGMMPNYYIKFLGGASKVDKLIGLAPDNHGTDFNGLLKFANDLSALFPSISDSIYGVIGDNAPGLLDQKFDSAFIKKLTSVPDTVPGVRYTVIATKFDEVVTPYRSAFLSGSNVKNITIQDKCILDASEHISIAFDHVALNEVLKALDPGHAWWQYWTPCTAIAPFIGG